MQLIIKQNQPLNHAQGLILSVLIYIYCLPLKTGPNGCRETQRTGTRKVAHKPRQDFSIQKGPFFFLLLWLSMWSNQRKRWALFAPIKKGHVELPLKRKWKKKEKKKIFFKKPNLLSLSPENTTSSLFLPPHCFLPFLLHHCCLSSSSKYPFISTPNCKVKLFLESRSLPLPCGTFNFR